MISELEAIIILASLPHLGAVKIRLLIDHFGSAANVLDASEAQINAIPTLGTKVTSCWGSWKKNNTWKKNLEIAEKENAEIIPYFSPKFPKYLQELPDAPVLLYVKGKLIPADQRSIAIVGTRHASIYGKEMAAKIAHELASAGFTIISGLARGIDTAAHLGALKRGRTIAIIGSGLSDIYPQENIPLAGKITEKGALISEFPMQTPPDRQNFPQRNRIVSGMTLATLLVEAPLKSGAMITMDRAFLQKKKLFALPGRADDENFRGNHELIKKGKAQLVESANDIIANFEDLIERTHYPLESKMASHPLEKEEREFLEKLPSREMSIEDIVQLTRLPVMKVSVMLMGLVIKKVIKEYPGKIFKK